jgi:hypothetical protein
MATQNGDSGLEIERPIYRQTALIVLGTALLLLAPLFAMQFTNAVNWDVFDFAIAGLFLVGSSIIYVLLASILINARFRFSHGVVLAVMLFLVWAELFVGIFGSLFPGTQLPTSMGPDRLQPPSIR